MDALQLTNFAGIIAGGIGFAMAAYERYYNKKKEIRTSEEQELVNSAKLFQSQAELYRNLAIENKALYEAEKADHSKTRNFYHSKLEVDQGEHSKLQEKLLDLERKPDYGEMLKELVRMNSNLEVQSTGITRILERLEK